MTVPAWVHYAEVPPEPDPDPVTGASGCYSWSLLFLLVLTPLIAVACGVAVLLIRRRENA